MRQPAATQHTSTAAQQGGGQLNHYAWLSLLRAFGVVLVLVFHFFPWLMPGGFIGVDVFFVFSGYLITSLLVKEFRKQGKVKLISFYKRRFRRLFPALLAMVLLTIPLTLTIPEDFRADIARQAAAALSWTTNFYEIAGGHSYADALLPHLFVHTWTLSIEMQYYLVWGLLLTILLPLFISTSSDGRRSIVRSRKVVALLAAVFALASYIVMQVMLVGAEDPSAAYYSTLSHAFPLLIGSVIGALAGFGRSGLVKRFERLNRIVAIGVVALSLIVITALALFLPFDNRLVYSVGLLLTSLLVGLIILVGRGAQTALHQIPEPKILQYLADRSYSIYLFHWPIMIMVLEWSRMLFGQVQVGPSALYVGTAVVGLVCTFIVSHLAYQFIEKPFSSKRSSESKTAEVAPDKQETKETQTARRFRVPEIAAEGKTSVEAPIRVARAADASTAPFAKVGAAQTKATGTRHRAAARTASPLGLRVNFIVVAVIAVGLLAASAYALASSNNKTSIELDYQVGLLELDRHQMENAHEVLVRTGLGGSMNGEPGLLVKPGTVTVIGDSVTIYPAEGITANTGAFVDAEVSRAMVNGIGIVDNYQASKMLGEFVVIALATNAHADSFESAIAICERLEPGHRLIFVTAHGTPSMADLSAALRTLPDTYPFVTIADWDAAISGQDYLLAADGYHLGGQEAIDIYVNVVLNAIEEAKNKPTS